MISITVNEKAGLEWNDRLTTSEIGNVYQTKEYAEYIKKNKDWVPTFLEFVDQRGNVIGQLLLYHYSRFNDKGTKGKLFKFVPGIKKILYQWVYGPIIFDLNYKTDIYLLLREYLISKKCRIFGSEHPLQPNCISSSAKPIKTKRWSTFLINLSEEQDSLWKKIDKHSARKNIERSQRRGVRVREMTEKDLPDYYSLLQETKRQVNWNIELEDVYSLWNCLKKTGFTGFIATLNDIPVGGILVSFFNKYVNEWGVGRSELDTKSKLYSQDLLKWEVIKWGINNKFRYYDLTGVNPKSDTIKESGIFRYKKKWGGKFVEFQTWNL